MRMDRFAAARDDWFGLEAKEGKSNVQSVFYL